jgi:predicted enzyme involved in methoxymalonyl-ACP biosynthesis
MFLVDPSVSEGNIEKTIHIDTFLMSCRVLGRRMEKYMMTELIKSAKSENVKLVMGEFIPTQKNILVKNLYIELGLNKSSHQKNIFFLWSGVIPILVNLLSLILSSGES